MKRFLLILFIAGQFFDVFGQLKGELKENFYWGETFILYEEYEDALPLYQLLLKVNPKNNNYKYRIGQCLLNIPGRKQEAIQYLEEAVKDINPKYKEGKFKETHAPYDAYYYLANAYRINNQLDKAIETYEIFKKNLDPNIYDTTVVNMQIESCRNAMELMKLPLYIRKENQGSIINDHYAEINPVVSDDETIMAYNKSEPFQEALYFTKKVNGKWSQPVNIIPFLGLGFEDKNYATSISSDGIELYIYRAGADYDGNIYMTRRKPDDTWTNLIKLNENINTKYWESHAAISHNGKQLYFTSNRKGSYGGLDIYYSDRDSTGDWGAAKNIGPTINTKYNEESPFLGKDDKTLFFSSRGHFNIGGYDIFYSTLLDDGKWSTPLNVGYPLNTTDDDLFFHPLNEGYQAYYAMFDSTGFGLTDIYKIEVFSKDHPRKFYIRGIVKVSDLLSMFGDSIKVSAISKENPDSKIVVYSNPVTGEYWFELPQGDYIIIYEAKDSETARRSLKLSLYSPADTLHLSDITLPKKDFISEMNIKSGKKLTAKKGDTLAIPVQVERNSIIEVEHWLGDSLLRTEKFINKDTLLVYKAIPETGDNRFVFKLTDRFSNQTVSELLISSSVKEEKIIRPEYKHVIAAKQANMFFELLKKRSDDQLIKVIQKIESTKQKFGTVDDIIVSIKNEASRSGIEPEQVDILALKVAVMDNVLSQAAVNILAKYAEGNLKDILSQLNIYEAGLKTWGDLQRYIAEKSGGGILPDELKNLALEIIEGIDPLIEIIRHQLITYGEVTGKSVAVNAAVKSTDSEKTIKSGLWLKTFYLKALENKLKEPYLISMFSALTAEPETKIDDYIKELSKYADGSLANWLDNFDPDKNHIGNPQEMLSFLIRNRNKNIFPEDEFFSSLAKFIAAKQVPKEALIAQVPVSKVYHYILWVVLGAGLIFFFIIFAKKRRKKEEKEEEKK